MSTGPCAHERIHLLGESATCPAAPRHRVQRAVAKDGDHGGVGGQGPLRHLVCHPLQFRRGAEVQVTAPTLRLQHSLDEPSLRVRVAASGSRVEHELER